MKPYLYSSSLMKNSVGSGVMISPYAATTAYVSPLSATPSAGGGSSFDNSQFDGNSRMMKVVDWKRQLTDAERQLLEGGLEDTQVHERAHRIAEMVCTRGIV